MEYYSVIKNETMKFAVTKMDLGEYGIKWYKIDRKRQISNDIIYLWNLSDTNELIYKTEKDSRT